MSVIRSIAEWLYSFVPDECHLRGNGCKRKGILGEENIVNRSDGRYNLICSDCVARQLEAEGVPFVNCIFDDDIFFTKNYTNQTTH